MLSPEIQDQLAARYLPGPRLVETKKAFDTSRARIARAVPQFASEQKAEAALVFVDIADFSNKVSVLDPKQVRTYLDDFYKAAIPALYKHGGEIDRIIGDGIIAVFAPFFDDSRSIEEAEIAALEAAKEIVVALHGSSHAAKAAVSAGELLFCTTGLSGVYEDLTVIGTPLTELYRLEDMAEVNQVVFRRDSRLGDRAIAELGQQKVAELLGAITGTTVPRRWVKRFREVPLRGVNDGRNVPVVIDICCAR